MKLHGVSAGRRAHTLLRSVLPMLLATPCSEAAETNPMPSDKPAVHAAQPDNAMSRYPHLRPNDRVGDLLNHPAFRGFSHRMLPWDGQAYDETLPLREIGQLLPYHSQVDLGAVVVSLNRMVDDVNAGLTVFYDFHTEAEKRANPALRHTGLFFFRGKPGAPFAVIAPGGGFSYVGSLHEGFPYAEQISNQGFNAFVLKYRAGQGGRVATEDLASAVSYIFQNASTLQVGTAGYSLWGSSAGARMAAAIGSHGAAAFGGQPLPRPSVVVMAYTGHSEVTASEPPTFVVVGEHDGIARPAVMEARVAALRRIGTPVEYHKYPSLGHGFGAGQGTSAQGWIDLAVRFWEKEIRTAP
ncbi:MULTISPECIES: alpha/beta hydrolase [Pseudomonadota]|uniref:alpha/beta hydrolase n=1 Tax=Pseudomonadota TaxID=1224 RepID=UPI0009AB8A12|nr:MULTISPECIES: alpha/beta hydrolase [Pseudomonadota]